MENRPLAELHAAVSDERTCWFRLAATWTNAGWQLALLEVTAGEPPPLWRETVWQYEKALFAAAEVRGVEIAGWLDRQRVVRGALEVVVGDLPPDVQVERRESRFPGVFEPLLWPSVTWSARLTDPYMQQPPGELVGDGLHPFLDFDQAAAALFGVSPAPSRSFSGREFVYRVQDLRARVGAVRIRPTEVVVAVSGSALEGTTLAIGGDGTFAAERLTTGSDEVRLPLIEPLPARAWLALHRDRELLDKRYLGAGWHTDVEVEVDPGTQLAVVVAGGEGPTTEFKRQLPQGDGRAIRTAIKSVAAFANGDGGTVVYGINDDGAVVGVGEVSLREAVDRLTSIISDYVRPLPPFVVEAVADSGVVLVRVEPGAQPPYGIGTSDREVVYYVRRGATTFPAAPNDVRAVVQAREPVRDPLAHLRSR